MELELTSTATGFLAQRQNDTAVDTSGFASGDGGDASTMGQFSAAELDFETRNWQAARNAFRNNPKHKDTKRIMEFLSQQESPQQAKAGCLDVQKTAPKAYAPGVGGVLSKIEAFMKVGDIAMKGAPER